MKRRRRIPYSAVAAAIVLVAAAAFGPIFAQAEPLAFPLPKAGIVMGGVLHINDDGNQVQAQHDLKTAHGLKDVTISLGRPEGAAGIHLETAVLIKPLKTDRFFVTFAAGTPVTDTISDADSVAAPGLRVWEASRLNLSGNRPPNSRGGAKAAADPQCTGNAWWADQTITPNRDELEDGANWYSKVALEYAPSQQWTMRAVLSMEYSDLKNLPLLSSHIVDKSRIGMAIDVDYQILESMILGFDYGHYRSGQKFVSDGIVSKKTLKSNAGNELTSGQVFSAKLKIRF